MRVCSRCKQALPVSAFYKLKRRTRTETMSHCKKCDVARAREARDAVRLSVLAKHCDNITQCALCGVTDTDVLGIDHCEGGGNQERKTYGKYPEGLYRQLNREPRRADLRVLCRNCNWKEYLRVKRLSGVE